MTQQQAKWSEEGLAEFLNQIEEKLQCPALLSYEYASDTISVDALMKACGITEEEGAGNIGIADSSLSFSASRVKKIPLSVDNFHLTEAQFHQCECEHSKGEEEHDGWYLVIQPWDKTFFWCEECTKCSVKVRAILLEADFTEIPVPDDDDEPGGGIVREG